MSYQIPLPISRRRLLAGAVAAGSTAASQFRPQGRQISELKQQWNSGLIAHQRVNALSFWEERRADCGKMVHLGFDEVSDARFVERLAWQDLVGGELLREGADHQRAAAGGGGANA